MYNALYSMLTIPHEAIEVDLNEPLWLVPAAALPARVPASQHHPGADLPGGATPLRQQQQQQRHVTEAGM
jgi:hypothetical protein